MLLALSSYISIPLWPVPITMQTYMVMVIGMTYGRKRAGATIGTFIVAGAVGLPVFSGGQTGLFFHLPSGGYIFGFFVSAVVLGYMSDRRHWDRSIKTSIVSMFEKII
jgi:biotin transport system substrate-specific component